MTSPKILHVNHPLIMAFNVDWGTGIYLLSGRALRLAQNSCNAFTPPVCAFVLLSAIGLNKESKTKGDIGASNFVVISICLIDSSDTRVFSNFSFPIAFNLLSTTSVRS